VKVLVTGAGGFIGRSLAARAPRTWEFHGLTRQDDLKIPGRLHLIAGGELPQSVRRERFDAVLHLAGNSNHGLAESEPWTDLCATGEFGARVIHQLRTRRLIILSSAAVYAGLVGFVDPETEVQPPMAYALSKLYVEGLARAHADRGVIETLLSIRLYNAFGPGERSTRFVPRLAAAIDAGVPFVLTGSPDSLSDPVHVSDVVDLMIAATTSEITGTFDYCGGRPLRLEDRIVEAAMALGKPNPQLEIRPNPAETPIRFYSDPRPITSRLGLPLPSAFSQVLPDYVQWLRAQDPEHET
jgi:nucleoside-diphosphate-sugar epimerase